MGYIAMKLTANTPIGSYSKTFKVTKDIDFTWQPISRFKLEVQVNDFQEYPEDISFEFAGKIGVKLPFLGWKYLSVTHHFSVPKDNEILENPEPELAGVLALNSADTTPKGCEALRENGPILLLIGPANCSQANIDYRPKATASILMSLDSCKLQL